MTLGCGKPNSQRTPDERGPNYAATRRGNARVACAGVAGWGHSALGICMVTADAPQARRNGHALRRGAHRNGNARCLNTAVEPLSTVSTRAVAEGRAVSDT